MALEFDGTTQYISIAQTKDLPIYNEVTYSVCGWIKVPGGQVTKRWFTERNTSSVNPQLHIGSGLTNYENKVRIFINNGAGTVLLAANSTTTACDDTWHHFCWVDNNGDADLYVDGVLDATNFNYTRSGTFTFNTTTIGVSRSATLDFFVKGQLSDFRCYNRCLTANEIAEIYHKRGADKVWQGLVGWWRLDELSSGNIPPLLLDSMDSTTGWGTSGRGTVSLNSSTYVQGSGALNLIKDQTTYPEAFMEKDFPSLFNLTGQTIKASMYIKDQTTLNKLKRAQFYLFNQSLTTWGSYSITSLSVGWNELSAYIDDFTPNGSWNKTSIYRIRVDADTNNTTDTWAEGDVIFDFYRAGDYVPNSIIDLSGNGNHGTPYNSPVYKTSPHRLRRGVLRS